MATSQDFKSWLDGIDLEDYDDVDSLYRTVETLTNYGVFSIAEANGVDNGWIVSSEYADESLHIPSEKARQTLLSMIESKYCEGMSEEGWYAFHRAMEKDD